MIPGLWGYSTLNGPAAQQLSALLKFGLLESQGSKEAREVKVSDLAVQILSHPSSDARQDAIQEAALLPPIHQEMWAEYGSELPSDSNLLWRLTRDRGFTETGAKEFVREWRETMAFAQLATDASAFSDAQVSGEDAIDLVDASAAEPTRDPEAGQTAVAEDPARYQFPSHHATQISQTMSVAVPAGVQQYPIPIALSGRPPVVISGAFPLSEPEWARFKAVLDAMKPVLVEEAVPTQLSGSSGSPE